MSSAQKSAPVKVERTALFAERRKLFLEGNEATGLPPCGSCPSIKARAADATGPPAPAG